jgi:hypothetical protein
LKKNIKAKIQFSDGNSKIIAMVVDKIYDKLVINFSVIILELCTKII